MVLPGWRRRLALSLCSTLVVLAGVELALRLIASRQYRDDSLDRILEDVEPLADGQTGQWKHLLRVRPEPDLVYDLRPDFDGLIDMGGVSTRVRTNADGLRTSVQPSKPPGTLRVVGIGDSFMMGYGLPEDETFLIGLEGKLQRRLGPTRLEAVNAGVGGYNLVQAVACLREKGLAYSPDLVLLGILRNDSNPIVYTTRATNPDPLYDPRPILPAWVRRRILGNELVASRDGARWGEIESALDSLASLAREHGFEVLAFTYFGDATSLSMLEACAARGLETCSLGKPLRAYMNANGIERAGVGPLALSPTDQHPSALHASLIAEYLFDALDERGILGRLAGRP